MNKVHCSSVLYLPFSLICLRCSYRGLLQLVEHPDCLGKTGTQKNEKKKTEQGSADFLRRVKVEGGENGAN